MTLPAGGGGADEGPPAEDGSVPADDHYPGEGDVSGQEGGVEGAGDWGPQRSAGVGILLEDTTDEHSGFTDRRRDRHGGVVGRVAVRADDRRDQGDEGKDVGQAGGVVLDAATQGGQPGQGDLAAKKEVLEEGGKAGLLVGGNGDGAEK